MEHELTTDQAREIVRLRSRHAGGELRVHEKPWGLILEVRERGRAVELEGLTWSGTIARDEPLDRPS